MISKMQYNRKVVELEKEVKYVNKQLEKQKQR
ncbi:hypothetical protein IIC_04363 [Bacillus cereus VD021]|uniref:Uncharacterized protein n=1 Tax=Bacillus cereus VD021 TaxID=1053224 RepID=R8HF43_BACCE|nr:hypothetical protein IIC_04363 [Bacillus cereus VD021]